MFRLTLLITGLISFVHFAFPQSFVLKTKPGDVLGVSRIEKVANVSVTKEAVTIYCINHGTLPQNLNILYENELLKSKFLDLDKMYFFKKAEGCDFELVFK